MTLEEDVGDVNGFAQTAAGKKAAQMERKRNKKRGGKARDDPALAFADVPYDPARPCDYVRVTAPSRCASRSLRAHWRRRAPPVSILMRRTRRRLCLSCPAATET